MPARVTVLKFLRNLPVYTDAVKDCIFCQIIARKAPARILGEDDESIVFLSRENHPLVAPKQHIPDLFGLSYALGAAVMRQTIRVARALKKGCVATASI